MWTGSASDGTELIENGVSRAVGDKYPSIGLRHTGIHDGRRRAPYTAGPPPQQQRVCNSRKIRFVSASCRDRGARRLSPTVRPVRLSTVTMASYLSVEVEIGSDTRRAPSLSDAAMGTPGRDLIEQYYADNTDDRTGPRSQRFTTGPHLHGYEESVGFRVCRTRGSRRDREPRGLSPRRLHRGREAGTRIRWSQLLTYPACRQW